MSRSNVTTLGRIPLPLVRRAIKFAAVGAFCFGVQYGLLVILVHYGMKDHRTAANGAAFMVSAQLNYVLSRNFTWRDRMRSDNRLRTILVQGVSYNATALLSLGVNSTVFWLVDSVTSSLLIAVSCGNGAGMVFTYLVLNRLVFRSPDNQKA